MLWSWLASLDVFGVVLQVVGEHQFARVVHGGAADHAVDDGRPLVRGEMSGGDDGVAAAAVGVIKRVAVIPERLRVGALQREYGVPLILITHDPADAEALGDAVWQMNRHGEEASLQAVSAPPVTPPAAEIRVNGIPLAEPHSLQLLAALAETPALTTVCQRLHIPVKRAQDTLDGLNNLAGAALTRCDGDKTHLTADGHAWLARVRTQAETFRQFLATHNINPTELLAMHFNISTRNQLIVGFSTRPTVT